MPPFSKTYQVIPGTITQDDGTTVTFSFDQLCELYNVNPDDCVLGPVPGFQEARYIKLQPRKDGIYDDIDFQVELGDEIVFGPDFDGKKKWIQETNRDTLYADRDNEQKL